MDLQFDVIKPGGGVVTSTVLPLKVGWWLESPKTMNQHVDWLPLIVEKVMILNIKKLKSSTRIFPFRRCTQKLLFQFCVSVFVAAHLGKLPSSPATADSVVAFIDLQTWPLLAFSARTDGDKINIGCLDSARGTVSISFQLHRVSSLSS